MRVVIPSARGLFWSLGVVCVPFASLAMHLGFVSGFAFGALCGAVMTAVDIWLWRTA